MYVRIVCDNRVCALIYVKHTHAHDTILQWPSHSTRIFTQRSESSCFKCAKSELPRQSQEHKCVYGEAVHDVQKEKLCVVGQNKQQFPTSWAHLYCTPTSSLHSAIHIHNIHVIIHIHTLTSEACTIRTYIREKHYLTIFPTSLELLMQPVCPRRGSICSRTLCGSVPVWNGNMRHGDRSIHTQANNTLYIHTLGAKRASN